MKNFSKITLLTTFLFLGSFSFVYIAQADVFTTTDIFVNGQDGYNQYRIPALITAPNGDLLAFCEGRDSMSDHGEIDMVMKRSSDGGTTWGDLVVISNMTKIDGNPGVVVDYMDPAYPDGRLFMVFNTSTLDEVIIRNGTGVREVWYMTSTDSGYTWTDPVNITTQVHRPNEPSFNPTYSFSEDWRWNAILPGSAIQLEKTHRGRLVFGANYSTSDWRSHTYAIWSDDHGQTWSFGGTPYAPDSWSPNPTNNIGSPFNENQIIELVDGRLFMNMRKGTPPAGFFTRRRAFSYSSDGGATWSDAVETNLNDPFAHGSMARYSSTEYHNQNRILFVNDAWGNEVRKNLTIRTSTDESTTWTGRVIDAGFSAYSDIEVLANGLISLIYEYNNYSTIRFVKMDLDWVTTGAATLTTYPQLTTTLRQSAASAVAGDEITYTATISNADNNRAYVLPTSVAAENVEYVVTLPAYLQLKNDSIEVLNAAGATTTIVEGNSSADDSVELLVDSLDPGESYQFSFKAQMKSNMGADGADVEVAGLVTAENWDENRDGVVNSSDSETASVSLPARESSVRFNSGSGTSKSNTQNTTEVSRPSAEIIPVSVPTPASPEIRKIKTKELQKFLNANGFPVSLTGVGSKGRETDTFGPLTRAALMKFQNTHNLPAVGEVDGQTRQKISEVLFPRELMLRMNGTDVKNLQLFLNSAGFLIAKEGPGALGKETTYFGPLTEGALIQFQKTFIKDFTRGVLDSNTIIKIKELLLTF